MVLMKMIRSTVNIYTAAALILALSLVFLALHHLSEAPQHSSSKWEKIAEDLDRLVIVQRELVFFSTTITFLRTSLTRYRTGVVHARDFGLKSGSVRELAEISGAVAAINANFFDERGKPLGLVISRGIQHSPIHRGGRTLNGIFAAKRDENVIIGRSALSDQSVVEAVQAGPLLLESGEKTRVKEADRSSNRSGVCLDYQKHLILFIVSSSLRGITLDRLQSILQLPEIRCESALNLDGGGSSQLFVSSNLSGAPLTSQPIEIVGRDSIPVALALFLNNPDS